MLGAINVMQYRLETLQHRFELFSIQGINKYVPRLTFCCCDRMLEIINLERRWVCSDSHAERYMQLVGSWLVGSIASGPYGDTAWPRLVAE